jgi:cytosine/adenosine deaminase-related metal-dependent hydrolase
MFMEMRTAALLSKLTERDAASGLAREVFDAATLGGARALRRDDLGRLAPGARADIVLVDLARPHLAPAAAHDPVKALVYCARGTDVDTVIVDGRVRVRDGQLCQVDMAALHAGARRFNDRLRASVAQLTYAGRPLPEFYGTTYPTH